MKIANQLGRTGACWRAAITSASGTVRSIAVSGTCRLFRSMSHTSRRIGVIGTVVPRGSLIRAFLRRFAFVSDESDAARGTIHRISTSHGANLLL